jgi:UDP-2,3-diacylglucosamine pyrophosphatase LpxH
MPIADLHLGDRTMDDELFQNVAKWLKEKPYRYTMIAGDIFNAALTTSVSDTYSETMNLDEAIKEFRKMVDIIGRDKILAVVRGNHDNRVVRAVGIDPVGVACELAGVTYCNAEAYLKLMVGDWSQGTRARKPVHYLCFMTHGVGGGRKIGSKINKMLDLNEIIPADLVVQGHTHEPSIVPRTRYTIDAKMDNIIEREQMFVTCPSFIGRDGYAQDFCFAPTSQAFPVVVLSGKKKKMEGQIKNMRG